MRRKEYEELEITDDFMFWNILTSRPDLCKELLELILGISIARISPPEGQKTIEMTYDAKGIRLDVYINDENGTVYDLEMQTVLTKELPKRIRYYQGMIDLNLIQRGASYRELKRSYIIFFCTCDPFGKRLPVYTFENRCREDSSISLRDDAAKVIINPESDRTGLSIEMNDFLDLLQGKKNVSGLAKKLSDAVDNAKERKKWEVDYMTMQMILQEERNEAREEGLSIGREEGLSIGREEGLAAGKIETLISLARDGLLTVDAAASRADIPAEQFRALMEAQAAL